MLQPRDVEVKHNGKVVRRMYPSTRRRREYWNYLFKKQNIANFLVVF